MYRISSFPYVVCLVTLAFVLSGCASTKLVTYEDGKRIETSVSQSQIVTTNERDEVLIYIIRPYNLFAAGVSIDLFMNNVQIGELSNHSFVYRYSPPGKIQIDAKYYNGYGQLVFDGKAGEIYFLKSEIRLGWFSPSIRIEILDKNEGEELLRSIVR